MSAAGVVRRWLERRRECAQNYDRLQAELFLASSDEARWRAYEHNDERERAMVQRWRNERKARR